MIKTISHKNLSELVRELEYHCRRAEADVNLWTGWMAEFNEYKIRQFGGSPYVNQKDVELEGGLRKAEGELEAYSKILQKVDQMIRIDIFGEDK